ncbi:MAG: P-type conjugative transfer protein TrbL, partial [Sphingobium sp.]
LGLGEAAASGRQAAWNALSTDFPSSVTGGGAGTQPDSTPAWARAMRDEQSNRHRRQLAIHTLQQGDRGGASATPDIKERND